MYKQHSMSVTLTHFEPYGENKQLEITVSYDFEDRIWVDIIDVAIIIRKERIIEGVALCLHSSRTDIFDLIEYTSEFNVAIEKICNRVNWFELYAETVNQ